MKICICLDKGDIQTCLFGLNYLICVNDTMDISLTKDAATELLSDLNQLLNRPEPENIP
jgi:hypothetical protein